MSFSTAPSFHVEPFRIGAVLGRSVEIFLNRYFVFAAIALIFFMPGIVAQYAFGAWSAPVSPKLSDLQRLLTPILITSPLSLIGVSTLIVLSMQRLNGDSTDVGAAFHQALGRFFPVLGIVLLLMALIMVISVTAGIVGGVAVGLVLALSHAPDSYSMLIRVAVAVPIFVLVMMVACMFVVAMPACLTERLGVWASLQRSRELTEGQRWRILGLLTIVGLPSMLLEFAGEGLSPLVLSICNLAFILLWSPFVAALMTVIFHDLRLALEGEGVIGGRTARID